jgi:hypothetical protein
MIKPEFWEDEIMAECKFETRLFFIALWNFADDEGFVKLNEKWLKAKCFPYDSVSIHGMLTELSVKARIQIRENIIRIPCFTKHQYISRPRKSELSQQFNDSRNIHGTLTEDSVNETGGLQTQYELENEYENEREEKTSPKGDGELDSSQEGFGDEILNTMLSRLKLKVQIEDFRESQKEQRIWAHNLIRLNDKISPDEFDRRLDFILKDEFKRKHCNSLQFIYKEIKSFVEPILKNGLNDVDFSGLTVEIVTKVKDRIKNYKSNLHRDPPDEVIVKWIEKAKNQESLI